MRMPLVAKVSKLNGLNIKVIGNSFIISIAIKIPINKYYFLNKVSVFFLQFLNLVYPSK